MPYIECPDCGHKALSVATRCPRCGHAFPARLLQRVDASRGRDWPSALLAGTIVIGAIVVVATLRRPGARPSERRAPAVEANAPATTRSVGVDRAPVAPKARSTGPADVAVPLAASGSRTTRYARTWVNVRDGRARGTSSVRVLSPGEQVLVDSLQGGWYRVLADGRAVGYVHRSNLDASPPAARP